MSSLEAVTTQFSSSQVSRELNATTIIVNSSRQPGTFSVLTVHCLTLLNREGKQMAVIPKEHVAVLREFLSQ